MISRLGQLGLRMKVKDEDGDGGHKGDRDGGEMELETNPNNHQILT